MVDLLVFGPHPDDLEIGLGGTIAQHAALGLRVGLCDLTAGEMGSNGTVEERLAEAEAARSGARRRVAGEPALARSPDRQGSGAPRCRLWRSSGGIGRASSRCRTGPIAIPITRRRATLLTEAVFNAGLRRYPAEGEAWKPDWICYYFINDSATPSFVVDVSDHYDSKRAALDCHASQFQPRGGAVATRLNTPLFRQLIESRDAQFGALAGVRWAEGVVVREPVVRSASLVKYGVE